MSERVPQAPHANQVVWELHIWNPASIALAIKAEGWTQVAAAKALNLSLHRFRYTIQTGANLEARRWISATIRVPETILWPERFPPGWRPPNGHSEMP